MPGTVTLTYDRRTPWTVDLLLNRADGSECVSILREWLRGALSRPIRSREVLFWPWPSGRASPTSVHLRWPRRPHLGEWVLPLDEMVALLVQTYALVARGSEESVVDLDAELTALLRG